MGKYEALARDIVKNVGGKENIISVTHCITRLRFVLKDEGKANDQALEKIDGVITLMKSAGQHQVVIGNTVPDVYVDVCEVAGIRQGEDNEPQEKKKRSPLAVFQESMTAIMGPLIAILTASGIIKGLLAILSVTGTLAETDGLYMLLDAAGNALFHFFPIFLGYSAAMKFKMSPFLGAAIGAAMVYPTIQGLEEISVFGLSIAGLTYTGTVIPIILIILATAPIERFLKRVLPSTIKSFVAPMLVLLICFPIGFAIIGPFANMLSDMLGTAIAGIVDFNAILAGFVISSLWLVLVAFGLHHGVFVLILMDLLAGNPSPIAPMIGTTVWSLLAVTFIIWFKTKDAKLKATALPAWISGMFGVTEPSIYGVVLPRVKFFIIACISAGIGGMYVAFTEVKLFQLSGGGIFSFPSFINADAGFGNLINYLIAIGISFTLSLVATFILFKDEASVESEETVDADAKEGSTIKTITSPMTGTTVPLTEVEDGAFSQELLGKGIAINPTEEKIVAPENGVLTTLFPTNHALGMTTDDGVEVLIHVGLDTVQLNGQHFFAKAKQGDVVKKGQVLLEFDKKAIEAEGYSLVTPVIITNTNDYTSVFETTADTVSLGDKLIKIAK